MTMTKTINHHLTPALLQAYSAGALPEAMSLAVATHLSMCDQCRALLASMDHVGGAVMESCAAAPETGSLDAVMARIKAAPSTPKPAAPSDPVLPGPVLGYVGKSLSDVRWRSAGMGVKQAILCSSDQATARLLYIPAGVAVPDHGHRGLELTLVLQGAFSDETGQFARGDIEIASDDLEHMPVADPGADCICLAVTEGPLRFKSWLPRIAQPFLRI
jgi:putative transcriptional regulator